MSGKFALIIGNTEYIDPGLAQLTAPGKDAEDFARILQDKELCAFDEVKILLNQLSSSVIESIDEFFDQKKPDDLLVLYFSGHGVRDELGSLYLAVKNTIRTRLRSTAIKSDYIREVMDQSRSKRQVLIMDCCNSGAFAQGTKAATGVSIGTATAFEAGYGRIILTASDSTQFAWEGDKVIGETDNSLFTHFLVKGLEGEADLDGDGRITVDEVYDYAYEKVRLATPKQTPSKFSSKQQGEIVLRQITRIEDIKPVSLPGELMEEIEDTRPYVREAAVQKLEKILKGRNIGLARSAREALEKIAADDNTTRRVSLLATQVLDSIRQAEKAEEERKAREEAERLSALKAEEERLAREKAEAERLLAEQKAEQERKAKKETKRLATLKAKEERLAREKAEADRLAKQKAEEEQKARQEAEHIALLKDEEERSARKKAEAERIAKEEAARQAALKAEKERLKGEKAEARRKAREKAEKLERAKVEERKFDNYINIFLTGILDKAQILISTLPQGLPKLSPRVLFFSVLVPLVILSVFWVYQQSQKIVPVSATLPFSGVSGGKLDVYWYDDGKVSRITQPQEGIKNWGPASYTSRRVYFTSDRSGKAEIYVLPKEGQLLQITDTPGDYESWSPSVGPSERVYFTSNRSGKAEIYALTKEGQLLQITDTPGDAKSWSPSAGASGNLYFTSNRGGKAEIWVLTEEGNLLKVTGQPGDYESWSPSVGPSKRVYFTSNRSGKAEIWVLTNEGDLLKVTDTPGDAESWSPVIRGQSLFYTSNRSGVKKVYMLTPQAQVTAISISESWTERFADPLPYPSP
jgi:hypothetical protein